MSPRIDARPRTLIIGLLVLLVVIVLATTVPVPLVILTPGPTFNTIGAVHGQPVVTVNGRPVYPTSGHLDMTTVGVTEDLNAIVALRGWLDGDAELVPRAAIYPPGKTDQQVNRENTQMFAASEDNAEVAALSFLNQPVKVLVGDLVPRAPAAGVLRTGDQLLKVKGVPVTSPGQVSQILLGTHPGDQVPVTYLRGDGPPKEGTVTVGARPDGPQGFLGLTPLGKPEQPDQITIKLGDIGGPSAGLAFALAIVDKLTPGELTGGRFVAGTGEITQGGVVGPIGGISLKMIAARRAGATVFLVPAANCSEAQSDHPDGLQLIKAGTLADAVNGLTALNQGRTPPGC